MVKRDKQIAVTLRVATKEILIYMQLKIHNTLDNLGITIQISTFQKFVFQKSLVATYLLPCSVLSLPMPTQFSCTVQDIHTQLNWKTSNYDIMFHNEVLDKID